MTKKEERKKTAEQAIQSIQNKFDAIAKDVSVLHHLALGHERCGNPNCDDGEIESESHGKGNCGRCNGHGWVEPGANRKLNRR